MINYTNDKFIELARLAHGDKYDYIDAYINSVTKIGIWCKKCNDIFFLKPVNHLSGQNCPKCLVRKPNSGHFKLGATPWNAGAVGVYSDEVKGRISRSLKDKYASGEIVHPRGTLGKKASAETRLKLRECHSGERHYNWRGGRTSLKKVIRQLMEYRDWRLSVFKRDNFKCVSCGAGGYLEADHINPFAIILNENKIDTVEKAVLCADLWDVGNGRTLCKPCHNKTKTYLWKSAPQNL